MTIFTNLREFTGKNSSAALRNSFSELLEQSRIIRRRLGDQAYLMDSYLSLILEATSKLQEFTTISNGLDDAMELRGICRSVISGNDHYSDHPFYSRAHNYIKSQPYHFNEESTREAYYVIALSHDFLEYKVDLFIKKQEQVLNADSDITEIRELFYKICGVIGNKEEMININRLFCQRFFTVTPTASFIQGLTSDLIYSMIDRDRETSRQIFQMILDQNEL